MIGHEIEVQRPQLDLVLARELDGLADVEMQARGVGILREIEAEHGEQDSTSIWRFPSWAAYMQALRWREER